MGIGKDLPGAIDLAGGDVALFQQLDGVLDVVKGLEPGLQHLHHFKAVCGTLAYGGVAGIVDILRMADDMAQRAPDLGVEAADDDALTVVAVEQAEGGQGGMVVALSGGVDIDIDPVHSAVEPDQVAHGGHIDGLSLTGFEPQAQGGHNGGVRALGGGVIAHRGAVLFRRTVHLAGDLHDAGEGLGHEIISLFIPVGSCLTKGGDGTIDQPRIDG